MLKHSIFEDILEESKPLHQVSLNIDIVQDSVETLVRYLQPTELIECLMSKGALTVEEYNMLLQEHQNQESFLKILTQVISTQTKLNSLFALVIECGPNYHYVGSTFTDCIEQKHFQADRVLGCRQWIG